jgi:8-hydroxy-5-deazaflavin:NADPH oxidoreductase
MRVAVIGTGRMGKALAKTFSYNYKTVWIAGRNIENTKRVAEEIGQPSLKAATIEEAIAAADIIIPTLWFTDEKTFVVKYQHLLKNKIYFNISVPFNDTFEDLTLPYGVSAAETIQVLLPEVKFVSGFKNTYWVIFDHPIQLNGLKSDVLINSDDELVKKQVIHFLQPLPFRFIDGGGIAENRIIERMTLLARNISKREGFYPRVSYHIWGG